MTKKISIPYFPLGIKFTSPLLFVAGVYLAFTGYPIWGGIFILIGIVILTTNYITEINLGNNSFNDYLFFLGFRLDEDSKNFNAVDRIVISKGNYAQTVNTRVQSRQFDWSDYTATLVLDNDTLDLLTKNSKEELLKGLKQFSDFLNVGVEDRTTNEYYWIDMTNI